MRHQTYLRRAGEGLDDPLQLIRVPDVVLVAKGEEIPLRQGSGGKEVIRAAEPPSDNQTYGKGAPPSEVLHDPHRGVGRAVIAYNYLGRQERLLTKARKLLW